MSGLCFGQKHQTLLFGCRGIRVSHFIRSAKYGSPVKLIHIGKAGIRTPQIKLRFWCPEPVAER
jgi:hypothetical protein